MVEDKDRTKEIASAIAQSHTTYGMQTFDQSLMSLFRQNIITYEEALRQSTNPDDFALRVSGISATSDSSWDGFDQKPEEGAQPAAAKPATPASRPPGAPGAPAPRPAAAPAPGSGAALGRIAPASRPAPAPKPAPAAATPAEDDFQIERF
jgi:twitching motility protein PilT